MWVFPTRSACYTAIIPFEDLIAHAVCDIKDPKCMLQECSQCPQSDGVKSFLSTLDSLQSHTEVTYENWITKAKQAKNTEGSSDTKAAVTLMSLTEDQDEFIDNLSEEIWSLTTHHFVADAQSKYLYDTKKHLSEDTCILLLDFAENYKFIAQDSTQLFYFSNTQTTLHPFVLYYKSMENAELEVRSFCIVSDSLNHTTTAVHMFQKKLWTIIKEDHPNIQNVIYFSDRAPSQYKNKSNFANMCLPEADFGIKLQSWNFFATSHGKSSCDGIGGTVKRKVTRHNLQHTVGHQILTPLQFHEHIEKEVQSIRSIWVTKEEIQQHHEEISPRFASTKSLPGTRKFHSFTPVDEQNISAKRYSEDNASKVFRVIT